jgi:molecular chaperone DnaK (HSP70)
MTEAPRFVVGIDLGTSNSALAYADLEKVRTEGRPDIDVLEILQLIAPGDVAPRSLLPSALYTPAEFELAWEQKKLPWSPDQDPGEPIVGGAAKRMGARTPMRLIDSAKSWLCHGGVNRSAPILPWHAPDGVPKLSPVDASAAFLTHLRSAWDAEMAAGDPSKALNRQAIVLTVPASFDEISRRLTLEAAQKAGLTHLTLIEEPLAAFYAFIARSGGTTATTGLQAGQRALIIDVGGGTTDFTLVEVKAPTSPEAPLGFERTAVGDHLLLGGDNMDLALAHALEIEFKSKDKTLSVEDWAQLKQECRLGKEGLFSHPDRETWPIVLTGKGSKLVGGTRKAELTREILKSVVLNGYFPELPAGEAAKAQVSRRAGLSEYGLPYASDPGITRHLASFLVRHRVDTSQPFLPVDALLFNGGSMKPPAVRDRVVQILGDWMRATANDRRPNPRPLVYDENDAQLELAVAKGAAYFGLVREGLGIRVGAGSPRTYFIGLGAEADVDVPAGQLCVLTVAPKGMQEGQRVEVSDREFQLVTNRPVEFPVYSTTSDRHEPVGTVLKLPKDELVALPSLKTVVKFGKQKPGTQIPVRIQAKRTELGTLELSCFSRLSGARFKLEFDLRSQRSPDESPMTPDVTGSDRMPEPFGGAGMRPPPELGQIEPEQFEAAKQRLRETFKEAPPRPDPAGLMKGLEEDFVRSRDAFPLSALRPLGEFLIEMESTRQISPELESRWLNLVGFSLRPGFGVDLDDWRVRQLWRIHAQGLHHPGHDPCELSWWILWRRVAGGLTRGHQEELASRAFPLILPSLAKRAKKKPPKTKSEEAAEIWRAASSLECISAKSRAQLGDGLLELIEQNKAPKGALWCLGRIGARRLLYGPQEATVKASTAAQWMDRLLQLSRWPKDDDVASCMLSLGRLVGDRQIDVDASVRQKAYDILRNKNVPEGRIQPLVTLVKLDAQTQQVAFGEGLPSGLVL